MAARLSSCYRTLQHEDEERSAVANDSTEMCPLSEADSWQTQTVPVLQVSYEIYYFFQAINRIEKLTNRAHQTMAYYV